MYDYDFQISQNNSLINNTINDVEDEFSVINTRLTNDLKFFSNHFETIYECCRNDFKMI